MIPLFRLTNKNFVFRLIIFTKNMIFIAKITQRKKDLIEKYEKKCDSRKKIVAKSISYLVAKGGDAVKKIWLQLIYG